MISYRQSMTLFATCCAYQLQIVQDRGSRFGSPTRKYSPAIALTPEMLAVQIADAGKAARVGDSELLQTEAARQLDVIQQLEAIVGEARSREHQRDAIIWAMLAGMTAVLALVIVRALFA
jgi:hypothetical protein